MAADIDHRALAPSLPRRAADSVHRFFDGDVFYSFRNSPVAMISFAVTMVLLILAVFAPWIAPHNTDDVSTLNLMNARFPPYGFTDDFGTEGVAQFLLGTDDQGRDILSAIIFGLKVSLEVGFASVILAAVTGTFLGLVSGYAGGKLDSFIMRIADVQLTFPSILIALLIDGIAGGLMPRALHDEMKIYVLIIAIAASQWVNFARTVRGSTLVEKNKEYVQAAKVIGVHPALIMFRHVLPNVTGPVLVIGTLSLAIAVLTEATLSFLGVGLPVTRPSLGTLIRIGQQYIFSGEWWMTIFPSLALVILVLAVNLLGDWLRDALNPKLR